jgi:ABC-type multidrug transport system fused ATPase/permease subunit
MIVVAHRLSTIRQANQVIVLQSGKVVEQGSYAELSTRIGSFFYSMLQKQNINIDDIPRKE